MNRRQKIEKNIFKFLREAWNFIKHPVVGLMICGLIAFIFYQLGSPKVKLRYYVSLIKPMDIFWNPIDNPEISILWKGKEIDFLISRKIVLWNAGTKYLEKSNILPADPIRIVPTKNIKILSAQVIQTSRPELKFITTIKKEKKNDIQYIKLDWEGDEVLEKHDGVFLKLLYTGKVNCDFHVLGRIKGCPRGFKETSIDIFTAVSPWWKYGALILFIAFFFIGCFCIKSGIGKLKKGCVFDGLGGIFGAVCMGISLLFFLLLLIRSFGIPTWLY